MRLVGFILSCHQWRQIFSWGMAEAEAELKPSWSLNEDRTDGWCHHPSWFCRNARCLAIVLMCNYMISLCVSERGIPSCHVVLLQLRLKGVLRSGMEHYRAPRYWWFVELVEAEIHSFTTKDNFMHAFEICMRIFCFFSQFLLINVLGSAKCSGGDAFWQREIRGCWEAALQSAVEAGCNAKNLVWKLLFPLQNVDEAVDNHNLNFPSIFWGLKCFHVLPLFCNWTQLFSELP